MSRQRRPGQATRGGRALAVVLLIAALLGLGSTAWAYWTSSGEGTGSATVATLNPPTDVEASFTPGLTSVGVSWTEPTEPTEGVDPLGYYVTRTQTSPASTAAACETSPTELITALACDDTDVTTGTYRYTVTAVFRSWSATSESSGDVVVVADNASPIVTVTTVNGVAATFPLRTNAALYTFGGACGTAPGDLASVTPLIDDTLAASVACSSAGTWTYTFPAPLSADGIVTLSATQSDAAGNPGTAEPRYVTIDMTRPTLVSIARTGAESVNTLPVAWTVTFSEQVSGVAAANFTLVRSGLSGQAPSIGSVTPSGASPSTTWTVSTNAANANASAGSIRLDLTSSSPIVDQTANTLATATFTGETYAYDTTSPTVTGVSSPLANGSYKVGQVITVEVTFSEPVEVTGTPQLTLATGVPGGTPVNYTEGSGSAVVTFNYTVAAGHTSADLEYLARTSLVGTFRDAATNAADLTLPNLNAATSLGGSKALVIDTTAPTVTAVSSSQLNNSYRAGQVIPITVTFSEPVVVTGTPQIMLETGEPGGTAVGYSSGTGTTTLTFDYTVAAGHTSADLDYVSTAALSGAIADAAANAATLTLAAPGSVGSLGSAKNLTIDTTAPAVTVTSVNGVARTFPYATRVNVASFGGTCGTASGDATTVTAVLTGATTTSASVPCSSGAWMWSLSAQLSTARSYTLSATQGDAAGNTGTAPAQTLIIDKTGPVVTGVSSTLANGSYRAGQVVPVTVTFSEPVLVTGSPRLALRTSPPSGTTWAAHEPGSPSNTMTFNYTVAAGHTSADLDYDAATSLALNGGTIRDAATNNATLTLPSPGASGSLGANKALVIDTTAPTVISVSSTLADGSYKAGQVVPVTVTFSEPVTVTGTPPRLTLATGPSATTAVDHTSGSGGTTLTFEYTVAAGDNSADLDYVDTTSLALSGGTIRDAAGNAATLALPSPATSGSLGASKALVIDTTPPAVAVTAMTSQIPGFVITRVRASGTAEVGSGPVTVYLCSTAVPVCDSNNRTVLFADVAVSVSGTWQTGWSPWAGPGTWRASATQTDAAGNVGTSSVFGPFSS